MSRLELVIDQIRKTRNYTEDLLDNIQPEDWFRQPSEGVTHIAWQVGHLAMAQYRLAIQRIRGQKPDDQALIPESFLSQFGKGSVPDPDPDKYCRPDEIRQVFDRVHQQVVAELESLPEELLDESTDSPHPMFNTKLGALQWSAQHEMLHAGQIGLLRRLFGNEPLR